jgi:hypothetical protein
VPQIWRLSHCDQYDREWRVRDDVDVVYIPGTHDQLFFKSIEARLVQYRQMPGGGKVLMHNGDNLAMFCSDPRVQPNLYWDVLHALVYSDEPRPHHPLAAAAAAQTPG